MSSLESVLKHQKTTKERMIWVMGERCQLCGYDKCIKALELHHVNPKEKEYSISGNLLNNSWEKLSKELEKCILLCANCHREIHDNIENYNLTSSFNFERGNQIKQLIYDLTHHKFYFCKECGKQIFKSGLCSDCSHKTKRKVERPNREILKELIRKKSFTSIGKEYEVCDNSIRKWCKSYNLPSTKQEINSYSDEDWNKI